VLLLMIVLGMAGVVLLLAAPFLARFVSGRRGDPTGLTRILQIVAVALLVGALLVRPYHRETAAVPPPPDAPEQRGR
jgi:hypothetical protein